MSRHSDRWLLLTVSKKLSHALVEIARKNAETVQKAMPARTKIEIIEGNAVEFPEVGKSVVLFLYNPFAETLIRELVENLERRIGNGIEELFLVYHNPVWAEAFDSSSTLARYHTSLPEYDVGEMAFSVKRRFPTVIWQNAIAVHCRPWPNAARRVVRIGPHEAILLE